MPVVDVNNIDSVKEGDLVIWNFHVIIFEELKLVNDELYAIGWWAGTGNPDDGINIINNVCHGKYKLDGEFIVRRPLVRTN
jgi:hypothetical protein